MAYRGPRVMITAAGTVTAQSLIKALRDDGRATFIAAGDMDPFNATKAFVDEFVLLPRADDGAFAQKCFAAAQRLKIDIFVPLIVEREFLPLDGARELFESIGCRLVVPPRDIVVRTADKLTFADFLNEIGIPGPATQLYREDISVEQFPVYLKPRRGSGSIGTARVDSAHSLHESGARARRSDRTRSDRGGRVHRRLFRRGTGPRRCGRSARTDRDQGRRLGEGADVPSSADRRHRARGRREERPTRSR